jgi:Ferritin-like
MSGPSDTTAKGGSGKPDDNPGYKIFPRNLTARAGYIVAGNPTNSRPEAGVDNCYPGLEFDQRNLDQRFFPGLVFYFHRADGAQLIEAQPSTGLKPADITSPPLYLWGMLGRYLVTEADASTTSFQGQSGMEVWRRVHDLLPGTVAIVFGPTPGLAANLTDTLQNELLAVYNAANTAQGGNAAAAHTSAATGASSKVVRGEDGKIQYAVVGGQRARYLDEQGVIDPQVYSPGDITKTMCAPWMYDFRDCYCFYWSSNKPDIVNVEHDGEVQPYVNFIRRLEDRSGRPPPDVNFYWKKVGDQTISRRDFELTYKNMVEGWSHKLPLVLNDAESPDAIGGRPRSFSKAAQELEINDVIVELSYLATVEHALTVEYLYAYYSMNPPIRSRDPNRARDKTSGMPSHPRMPSDDIGNRIAAAADQIFAIATDEMRHFMWANLALKLLGAPSSTGRAERIAEPPDPKKNGRKPLLSAKIDYLDQPFQLRRLDAATLDWFIKVEAPSKQINEGLDGMYVYILEALELRKDRVSCADRLIPMIKLIIDEGEGHWRRFTRIKETLAGIPETVYLRPLSSTPPGAAQLQYLDICDSYYGVLLNAISLGVSVGWEAQPKLVQAAIRLMQNLDEMALVACQQGYLPRFTLPSPPKEVPIKPMLALEAAVASKSLAHASVLTSKIHHLQTRFSDLAAALGQIAEGGAPADRLLAVRHRQHLAEHVAEVDAILLQDLQGRQRP